MASVSVEIPNFTPFRIPRVVVMLLMFNRSNAANVRDESQPVKKSFSRVCFHHRYFHNYKTMAASEIDIPVRPRILIADDSRIVRLALIKRIDGMFDFREACNGEEAWEMLLADGHIRVLITDLTMPRLDGYGLLQRIRQSSITRLREMPVVVISGSDEQRERDRALAAGASDLITRVWIPRIWYQGLTFLQSWSPLARNSGAASKPWRSALGRTWLRTCRRRKYSRRMPPA